MSQSECGIIRLFEDFCGAGYPVAGTGDYANIGPFQVGGEGIEDSDTGVVILRSDGLSGVGQMISGNTDLDTTAMMTGFCFDVGLMGPIVLEVRTRFPDLDDKAAFIGFANSADDDIDLATDIIDYSAGTTVSYAASNLIGFYWSSEFTDDEDWHAVYKGGDATAVTTTTSLDLDCDAVAGEFQILRLELDPNGTARWYVDGVLQKTLAGAVSTSTDLAMVVGVTANTTELGVMEVDYILCTANRDWTV